MTTTKQGSKGKEILEDPEVIFDKFRDSEAFFQKNKKPIVYIGTAIVVLLAAFFFYKYQQNESNQNAQTAMINAVFAWEKDSLKQALQGNPKKDELGLADISEEYSGTKAGNLADYYAGVALLKEGKFEDAIEKLKAFNAGDLLLQGHAYALIGDAYMEQKDYENAEEYYAKAANYKPSENFTPNYLMKLALSLEIQKKFKEASDAYSRIIKEYPKSRQISDAKKYKAKDDGLASSPGEKE